MKEIIKKVIVNVGVSIMCTMALAIVSYHYWRQPWSFFEVSITYLLLLHANK